LFEAFGDRLKPAAPLAALAETDRLGRKNGRGFYRWEAGEAAGADDSALAELGDALRARRDTPPDVDEMRQRLVLAMVNEAARVLEDGIVRTAGEVDLAMIMGTGFPPFRGGLLRFADAHHARSLVEMLEGLENQAGARFAPAPVLRRLAADDLGFYTAFGDAR
jgi:3-hydroxyacyl-CoA dehydrogenase/enoyl-CoA hydratase/3-hydroxybutyryl-CoA epimerase